MTRVLWLSYRPETPNRYFWDMALLEDLFSHRLWHPVGAQTFSHCTSFQDIPEGEGAVIVLPARHHADYAERLNADIARLPWVVLYLIGDEENVFPVFKLSHPNLTVFQQMKEPSKLGHGFPNGYTPDTKMLDGMSHEKNLDWFFSGQITHIRREQCASQLRQMPGGYLYESKGFTQGLQHEDYFRQMAAAKIVPCPSGPVAPDTFRVYEALEAGCIPILDSKCPIAYLDDYWRDIFGKHPLPVCNDWNDLPFIMDVELSEWPANVNRVAAWWMWYKRKLAYQLQAKLPSVVRDPDDIVTILIPTSPIPSHPDTKIIENTVQSLRHHFPRAEMVIMFDGVRPELEHRRADYQEYTRRIIWKCQREWRNVLPVVFERHLHQATMTRIVIENDRIIETPLLLFAEHDTPVVVPGDHISWDGIVADTRRPIDWQDIFALILSKRADMVRLSHRGDGIPPEHQYLMGETVDCGRSKFVKTQQWCQRPHVASTEFYRRILFEDFSATARTMIEDRMMGVCQSYPWEVHKIFIYEPELQRSYHTEGRHFQGVWDSKFESTFTP